MKKLIFLIGLTFLLVLNGILPSKTFAQISVSGGCFDAPFTLTLDVVNSPQNGKNYYYGSATIGSETVAISVKWDSPYWFLRLSGKPYYLYEGDTTLPPNNKLGNWAFINEGSNASFCPQNSTIEISGAGTQNDPLPVTLSSFKSETLKTGILLHWVSETETDNAGFEIKRSIDTKRWESIGFIDGQYNSYSSKKYRFQDPNPHIGDNYYQLKQLNIDGSYEFSRIISAKYSNNGLIISYPNPTEDFITMEVPGSISVSRISVLTNKGVPVKTFETKDKTIDIKSLTPGLYFLEIFTNDGEKLIHRFVKK